jgi:hypothetical protein
MSPHGCRRSHDMVVLLGGQEAQWCEGLDSAISADHDTNLGRDLGGRGGPS